MEKIKEIPYYGKCKEVVVIKSRPMKMTPFLIKLQKEKEKEHHLGYWKHFDFLEDIEKQAEEIWANEVNEEDLMNKAIAECIELDKKSGLLKGNRDNLD